MHEGTRLPNPENKNSCKKKSLPKRSSLIIPFLAKALPPAQPGCRSYRAAVCVAVKLEHRIIREKAAYFFGCVFKEPVADRWRPEPWARGVCALRMSHWDFIFGPADVAVKEFPFLPGFPEGWENPLNPCLKSLHLSPARAS